MIHPEGYDLLEEFGLPALCELPEVVDFGHDDEDLAQSAQRRARDVIIMFSQIICDGQTGFREIAFIYVCRLDAVDAHGVFLH